MVRGRAQVCLLLFLVSPYLVLKRSSSPDPTPNPTPSPTPSPTPNQVLQPIALAPERVPCVGQVRGRGRGRGRLGWLGLDRADLTYLLSDLNYFPAYALVDRNSFANSNSTLPR